MPPRKRKGAGGAEQQPAEGEASSQLPDREETALKIKEKLEALDRAGESRVRGGWPREAGAMHLSAAAA